MYMYVCVCICMYVCVYIYIYVSLSAVAGFNSTKVQILTLKALVEPAAKKRGWALPGQLLRSIDSGGERERGGCHALEGGTFAKHGNVGQVELHEAKDADNKDDFKNYGINIKGRFRAKQDLQLLNSNVQSGGEKSLSIMLFILALQDMIKVPFRVVDEINQGMDKHYERAIFERIVEVLSLLALLVEKYKY